MAEIRMGFDGKLYYGTAGSQAATEMTNCKDPVVTMETGMADVTRRGSGRVRSKKPTLKDVSIEWTMIDVASDAAIAAVRAAFWNHTPIALWARDADDGEGPDGDFYISSFTRDEANEEGMSYKIKAEPCDENRTLAWS
jgi:hypothetical protein